MIKPLSFLSSTALSWSMLCDTNILNIVNVHLVIFFLPHIHLLLTPKLFSTFPLLFTPFPLLLFLQLTNTSSFTFSLTWLCLRLQALDSALKTRNPLTVVTVLEELNRRGGLSLALAGRGDRSHLTFLTRVKSFYVFYIVSPAVSYTTSLSKRNSLYKRISALYIIRLCFLTSTLHLHSFLPSSNPPSLTFCYLWTISLDVKAYSFYHTLTPLSEVLQNKTNLSLINLP